MKPKKTLLLVHGFAILGTSAFWLGVQGSIFFITKESINPLALIIHSLAITLISYSLDGFRQYRANRDFSLVTVFRPVAVSLQPNSASGRFISKRTCTLRISPRCDKLNMGGWER